MGKITDLKLTLIVDAAADLYSVLLYRHIQLKDDSTIQKKSK